MPSTNIFNRSIVLKSVLVPLIRSSWVSVENILRSLCLKLLIKGRLIVIKNKPIKPADIIKDIHHLFLPKNINICASKQTPIMKIKDFEVEDKPQKTNAKNRSPGAILRYHFFAYKSKEEDKIEPRPINKAMSLMSPNFEPSLENCK